MAKYGKAAQRKVKQAVHEYKRGKLKSRKQAIAIGLSQARKRGAKVPKRRK